MKNKTFKRAYSLLELSIVIIIISILVTGALSVSVGSINNIKVKTTNNRIAEIYKAMGNFLIINKRLPCPASIIAIKTSDSGYGSEVGAGTDCEGSGVYQSTTSDYLVYGMVPVRALGMANDMAEDAFGNKFSYIVHKKFTNTSDLLPDFNVETFSTTTPTGIMTINEMPSGITQAITDDAIIAIISHGANKLGAFDANSSSQNTTPTDNQEKANIAQAFDDSPTPKTALFSNIKYVSSDNSDEFDDIVFFKRRNDIIEDFNAMFLIPCEDAGADFLNVNANYGQVVYASASCSFPNEDKRLTKKCEAYGTWVDIVSACPL